MNVRPPVVALLSLLLAASLHEVLDPMRLVRPAISISLGAALVLGGIALGIWGLVTFHRSRTTFEPFEEPTNLVTDGPYQFTRNPMYVGLALVLAGAAAAMATWPMLLAPVLFVAWMDQVQVPREEMVMRELFGDAYLAYCQRVRRWL